MIITIDGPAGTGKSTVANRVAELLGYTFFDTGAMYRAVTYGLRENGIPLNDTIAIENYLREFRYHIESSDRGKRYFIGDEDVTEKIRSPDVTNCVSAVSAIKGVRDDMVLLQRRFGHETDAVFEGRDMGSVVFPHADVKVYLDASPEVRAQRRYNELVAKDPQNGRDFDRKKVFDDIMRRDALDSSRKHAPLLRAADAHYIDSTDMLIDDVVNTVIALVASARG